MAQTRSPSYDNIMAQVLFLAQKSVSKQSISDEDKRAKQQQKDGDAIQKLQLLINDIDVIKKTEKDPNKCNVLYDAGLFIGLLHWGAGFRKQQPSLYQAAKFLVWYKAPRWLVENRSPQELAQDILNKVEIINQSQTKLDDNGPIEPATTKRQLP